MTKPTAIDLFSGLGGLSLGLRQAGFDVLAGIELDELALESYQANHLDTVVWNLDIRRVKVRSLRRILGIRPGELDLLAACPPCQGFSSMRTHNRASVEDPRNDLVLEVLRFCRWLMPKILLVENVPGLRADSRFRELRRGLRNLGYRYRSKVVDAADYGVPQRRRRLILIATRSGVPRLAAPSTRRMSVSGAFEKLRPSRGNDPLHDYPESRSDRVRHLIEQIPLDGGGRAALGEVQLDCHKRLSGFHDVYGRMAWSKVAPTITGGCVSPSKGRFLHPAENRAITLREAALLQSFPIDYRVSLRRGKYAAAALIGNALPPELMRRQARAAIRHLERDHGSATR